MINQKPINQKLLYSALLTKSQKRFMNSEGEGSLACHRPQTMGETSANLEIERPIGLVHRNHDADHFALHCSICFSRLLQNTCSFRLVYSQFCRIQHRLNAIDVK